MKNAHLRFGWLTYVKSTEKTTTSIRLHLDRFIGEMLPDPPRQAKAHLISVIGGDTQISAISAAISMGDRFMVEGPRVPPEYAWSETLNASRVPYSFRSERNRCGTSLECPRNSPPQACRRIPAERYWLAPTINSCGLPLRRYSGCPECRRGLAGLRTNSRRIVPSWMPLASAVTR